MKTLWLFLVLLFGTALVPVYAADTDADGVPVEAADTDGDGVPDTIDNCTLLANPEQVDSDADGYGNRCDGDWDGDGLTTPQDFRLFRRQVGKLPGPGEYLPADINTDGVVNNDDYVLFRQMMGKPLGPSARKP